MKECFCGCGRTVPRLPLGMRSINERGKLVVERLEWGTALVGDEPEFAEWLTHGHAIAVELQAAMHGESDPRGLDEDEVRTWQEYGRGMEGLAAEVGFPDIAAWLAARAT